MLTKTLKLNVLLAGVDNPLHVAKLYDIVLFWKLKRNCSLTARQQFISRRTKSINKTSYTLCTKCISMIVVAITTDDNRINQNMFKHFTANSSYTKNIISSFQIALKFKKYLPILHIIFRYEYKGNIYLMYSSPSKNC